MRRRRGFLLILVLLLTTLLLLSGMALLTKEGLAYGGGRRAALRAQAESLADMGLQDVLVKFEKDINFPLRQSEDQMVFSWSEDVMDFETGDYVGQYTVTLDRTYDQDPFWTIRVSCVGRVGEPDNPRAVFERRCEFDTSGPREQNRAYGRLVHLES